MSPHPPPCAPPSLLSPPCLLASRSPPVPVLAGAPSPLPALHPAISAARPHSNPPSRHRSLSSALPLLLSIRHGRHLRLPPRMLGGFVRRRHCRSCVGLWWSGVRPVPTPVAPPNLVVALSTVIAASATLVCTPASALDGADLASRQHDVLPSMVTIRSIALVSAITLGSPLDDLA
jgi:hypothetical protein